MKFERVITLPYDRKAGPVPVDHLLNGEVESLDAANCQRVVQLLFSGMGMPLGREKMLSMEAFSGLGEPVIINQEHGGLSLHDIIRFGNNLDVVFAELLYTKDGEPIVRNGHWDDLRTKSLHMGVLTYDHVVHSHLQGGTGSFDHLQKFMERYSVVGLRRLDTSTAPNVDSFLQFSAGRISEQYPPGHYPQ